MQWRHVTTKSDTTSLPAPAAHDDAGTVTRLRSTLLGGLTAVSAVIFLAYIGLYFFDFGLFVTLPEGITRIFIENPYLMYVALALLVAAMIAKIRTDRAMRRDRSGEQN